MKLTPKQKEAIDICSNAEEILFYGGSRSGKTTVILLTVQYAEDKIFFLDYYENTNEALPHYI
jgi:predicted AAA+ superfamily ATPase